MQELDLPRVAVIALAKRIEEVFVPGRPEPILLPRHSPGLQLLQRIRDEAHRFAITFHRQRRDAARARVDVRPARRRRAGAAPSAPAALRLGRAGRLRRRGRSSRACPACPRRRRARSTRSCTAPAAREAVTTLAAVRWLALASVAAVLAGCGGSSKAVVDDGGAPRRQPGPGTSALPGRRLGGRPRRRHGARAAPGRRQLAAGHERARSRSRSSGRSGTAAADRRRSPPSSSRRRRSSSRRLWVDGTELLEKGGGLTPTRGTIYGAPSAPLAHGQARRRRVRPHRRPRRRRSPGRSASAELRCRRCPARRPGTGSGSSSAARTSP